MVMSMLQSMYGWLGFISHQFYIMHGVGLVQLGLLKVADAVLLSVP